MHPKTEIQPRSDAIEKLLRMGWVGQIKIHGHRAQIHIPKDESAPVIAYTRQGKLHTKALSLPMIKEIRRVFSPITDWNAIDAEWCKAEDKLYIFDLLKKDGQVLRRLTYPDRWKLLPRDYLSPHLVTLPLLRDLPSCMKALGSSSVRIEGLVFKSNTTRGFSDTSIVRCRRTKPKA